MSTSGKLKRRKKFDNRKSFGMIKNAVNVAIEAALQELKKSQVPGKPDTFYAKFSSSGFNNTPCMPDFTHFLNNQDKMWPRLQAELKKAGYKLLEYDFSRADGSVGETCWVMFKKTEKTA
ncbi:MAG: hypothetical protein OXR68_01615 [Alphaproteobacteria bacterium]|nr:hypothetical protein [Alphaproteobacteria bacterium]MDD9919310.1 hypothetical protein [Alphaproteobacteria bacterium]